MTQEEKELLLKDLCARLPYRVKGFWTPNHHERIKPKERILNRADLLWSCIGKFKPYLRPLSSMTKEEDDEWWKDSDDNSVVDSYIKAIDWLNANHFDYRGLIEKGLAIEAPKGMYRKEDKQ